MSSRVGNLFTRTFVFAFGLVHCFKSKYEYSQDIKVNMIFFIVVIYKYIPLIFRRLKMTKYLKYFITFKLIFKLQVLLQY